MGIRQLLVGNGLLFVIPGPEDFDPRVSRLVP
jgi:hypothetical protein